MKKNSKNIHANHRTRVKKKFIESGLSAFADHEILEMLLFYSIPQADTNETAHNLINTFGSLNRVFDADHKDLTRIAGIGENSATLIKLCRSIVKRYNIGAVKRKFLIKSQKDAIDYISTSLRDFQNEVFLVVCLDADNKVYDTKELGYGTSSAVNINIRDVSDYTIRNKCEKIIIAHNHPVGGPEPSDEDLLVTYRLIISCLLNDIDVVDHIIYSPANCYSFAETGAMKMLKHSVLDKFKHIINEEKQNKLRYPSPNYEIIPRNIEFKPIKF